MKTTTRIALLAAALCASAQATAPVSLESAAVVTAVKTEISANSHVLLQTVTQHVTATPQFACEIVKTAIRETKADAATVASIVEAAVLAAPDQMRLVAQCAIAMAPDCVVEIQQVVAKLDSAAGDDVTTGKEVASGKGVTGADPAADGLAMDESNPLNFPTGGQSVIVGPTPSSQGGKSLLPIFVNNVPPVIAGTPSTQTNL